MTISVAAEPVTRKRGPGLLFVLLLMVVPGSQLLIYPVLWILMPAEESISNPAQVTPHPTV